MYEFSINKKSMWICLIDVYFVSLNRWYVTVIYLVLPKSAFIVFSIAYVLWNMNIYNKIYSIKWYIYIYIWWNSEFWNSLLEFKYFTAQKERFISFGDTHTKVSFMSFWSLSQSLEFYLLGNLYRYNKHIKTYV